MNKKQEMLRDMVRYILAIQFVAMKFVHFVVVSLTSVMLYGQDEKYQPDVVGTRLVNPTYIVDYNDSTLLANWVHYELTALECQGQVQRTNDFREDSRVKHSAKLDEYRGSGYDRGHLKPAADSKSSRGEMSRSFLLTNIAPQTPSLNRGKWKILEQQVRDFAKRYNSIYVSTGPARNSIDTLENVVVPEAYWKAILRTYPDTNAIAFLFPNESKMVGGLGDYSLSINELELFLSLDLFSGLAENVESNWDWKTWVDRDDLDPILEVEEVSRLLQKSGGSDLSALRPGVASDSATKVLALDLLREGWIYKMPEPKSAQADWLNTDGRTTWWYGQWENGKRAEYSHSVPVQGNDGLYHGDGVNKDGEWRKGGCPRRPTVIEWLCSKHGGVKPLKMD